jgi:hypothetical protein
LVCKIFPYSQGMWHLAGWIPAKEADAVRPPVDGIRQILRAHGPDRPLPIPGWVGLAVMPVLAEEAIQGAAGIEDSQVVVVILLVSRTNPICHAVGRERVPIPVQKASLWRSSHVNEATIPDRPHATKAPSTFGDAALTEAENALGTFLRCRCAFRQIEQTACAGMGRGSDGKGFYGLFADAVQTDSELGSDEPGLRSAKGTVLFVHLIATVSFLYMSSLACD